jgi:acetoacetyl-CoA synthetase
MDAPIWAPTPQEIEQTRLSAFIRQVNDQWGTAFALDDFAGLWRWSVDNLENYWVSAWDFCNVIAQTRGERVLVDGEKMPGARFFPDARLNFAQNLLRRRDEADAIVFWSEDVDRRRLSWRELYDAVSRLVAALRDLGLKPDDRCAGFVPNMPETIIAMLACTALGGVWTSCSPDFGKQGVLDRFGQTEPRFLFTADGYRYNGKSHASLARVAEFLPELPSVEKTIVFSLLDAEPDVSGVPNAVRLDDLVAPYQPGEIEFEAFPFYHPLYVMYSSGTTGVPKCILHSVGGTLLSHVREQQPCLDIRADDRLFFFTTCGWMMWNWLATALAAEATILLYDGSPFYPAPTILFDYMDAERANHMGVGAKFIDAIAKQGVRPIDTHDLSSIRAILSTGSPLAPEGFDYIYENVKSDVRLSSVAGGTDLIGCLVGANPNGPVWRGEIQGPCLGMAIDVFDDQGRSVTGVKGELVCTRPFPSMPLGFWNDPGDEIYHAAYYETFPNIWHHGDFVARTEHGGYIIYGRSDATLNSGGVRIGTAEIYRQVEKVPDVLESVVIGQEWENDTRIVLFVVLRDGVVLNDAVRESIKKVIRANCTPRHVPAKIVQVAAIPRTKSNKIVELAVREAVHGRTVKNLDALANPEALEHFRDLAMLAQA